MDTTNYLLELTFDDSLLLEQSNCTDNSNILSDCACECDCADGDCNCDCSLG